MATNLLLRVVNFILMNLTNLYSVPAFIVWTSILRPLQLLMPQWYYTAEGILYSGLLHFVSFWVWLLGFTVSEAGDAIEDCIDSECLILANHQSTGDVLTMVQVLTGSKQRRLSQHVCWVLDDMFKYTHFGLVCRIHGDIFILQLQPAKSQTEQSAKSSLVNMSICCCFHHSHLKLVNVWKGRNTRETELSHLANHLRNVYAKRDRTWIIMFPEGGFLRNRRATSQEYGRKHGFPHLEHCTLPRAGAVRVILDTLSTNNEKELVSESFHRTDKTSDNGFKNLKYVIDVTIGYPNGCAYGVDDVVFGFRANVKTVVHYRIYPVSTVPRDEEGLLHWMYARYAEKDQLLDRFYKTGSFLESPTSNGSHTLDSSDGVLHGERTLSWNSSWCWMIHAFYIASMCTFMYLAFRVFGSIYHLVSSFAF